MVESYTFHNLPLLLVTSLVDDISENSLHQHSLFVQDITIFLRADLVQYPLITPQCWSGQIFPCNYDLLNLYQRVFEYVG